MKIKKVKIVTGKGQKTTIKDIEIPLLHGIIVILVTLGCIYISGLYGTPLN